MSCWNTSRYRQKELLHQIIWACMQYHICFHIQSDTTKYKQI
jgi:hypothetical protein